MNDELLFERLASHDGPAAPDGAFDDRLYAILEGELRGRRPWRPALLLAATLVLVLTITAALAVGSGLIKPPWMDRLLIPIPSPTNTIESPSTSQAFGLGMGMPGMNPDEPAGLYGWAGHLGSRTGMHKVIEVANDDFRMTQLFFAITNDCFAYGTESEPVPVTVAGLDGLYVEPYADPDVLFFHRGNRVAETTGAYALAIGGRTLCVYLTWDPDTTPDELDAARQVVESIRAQPFGDDGIQINFTLPEGWDTG